MRQTDRLTETEIQKYRGGGRERETHTHTHTQTDRQTDRDTERQTERERLVFATATDLN